MEAAIQLIGNPLTLRSTLRAVLNVSPFHDRCREWG